MKDTYKILIPDGESGHSLIVARCLAELGNQQVYVMSSAPKSALRYSLRKTKFYYHNSDWTSPSTIDQIRKICGDEGIDIILPVDEPAIEFISNHYDEVSEITNISHLPDPHLFDTVTDKFKFSEFLDSHSIPSPKTVRLNGYESDQDTLDFPFLIKPVRGHGGHEIKLYNNASEFESEVGLIHDKDRKKYLLQKKVNGYDIDCSAIAIRGKILAYTIQKGFLQRPNPFAAPAGIQFLSNDEVLNVVTKMISELKFNGIAHIDLRYDSEDNNYKVIELNPRYWGSLTGSLLAGVNFPYLACLAGLDLPIPSITYQSIKYIAQPHAIRQIVKNVFRGKPLPISSRQTDTQFFLSDPVAEVVNVVRRRGN